jgi:hypothetical protein
MRLKLLFPVVGLLACLQSTAQGLTVKPGTFFITRFNVDLVIQNGSLNNGGNGNFSESDLYLTGNAVSSINGTKPINLTDLFINKPVSSASLGRDVFVSGEVVMQNGLFDLNGHILTLSSTGSLMGETETNRIIGPKGGYITITLNMDAPLGSNPGNLGALIASTKNLGAVTIKRGHDIKENNGSGKSVARYYSIQPTNNTALGAIFRFSYFDNELNGLDESTLTMWKSNNGTSWTDAGLSGRNTALNFVDLAGVNSFTSYTLSSPSFTFSGAGNIYAQGISNDGITVAPNPVVSTGIVKINNVSGSGFTIKVFTIDGRLVLQQGGFLSKGSNQASMDMSRFPGGIYNLVAEMNDGNRKNILFIKQ